MAKKGRRKEIDQVPESPLKVQLETIITEFAGYTKPPSEPQWDALSERILDLQDAIRTSPLAYEQIRPVYEIFSRTLANWRQWPKDPDGRKEVLRRGDMRLSPTRQSIAGVKYEGIQADYKAWAKDKGQVISIMGPEGVIDYKIREASCVEVPDLVVPPKAELFLPADYIEYLIERKWEFLRKFWIVANSAPDADWTGDADILRVMTKVRKTGPKPETLLKYIIAAWTDLGQIGAPPGETPSEVQRQILQRSDFPTNLLGLFELWAGDTIRVGTADPLRASASDEVRYIAGLVNWVLKQQGTDVTYVRGVYYYLRGAQICITTDRNQVHPCGSRPEDYGLLSRLISEARNSGVLEFEKIYDQRIGEGLVYPKDRSLRTQKADSASLQIDLVPEFKDEAEPDIDVPLILLYTEKASLIGEFKKLQEEYYNVGYFVAEGQISTSSPYEIMKFTRERTRKLIVLTFTDDDVGGRFIPIAFAQKLRYHWYRELAAMDARKTTSPGTAEFVPAVLVLPAFYWQSDIAELKRLGVPPDESEMIKVAGQKVATGKFLIDQLFEWVGGKEKPFGKTTVKELIIHRITQILGDGVLIRTAQVTETQKKELEKAYTAVTDSILPVIRRVIPTIDVSATTDAVEKYRLLLKSVANYMESIPPFPEIRKAITDTKYIIKDVQIPMPMPSEVARTEEIFRSYDKNVWRRPYKEAQTAFVEARRRATDLRKALAAAAVTKSEKK